MTKCDRLLLKSASGITKCDRRYYKVRQVLQRATVITKWDVTPEQTTNQFMRALKRLVARGGCHGTIYLDNAKL